MTYRDKTPTTITLLIRRLKPGKTLEDFEKAHLPPVECEKTELGYDCEFFGQPTRVINCVQGDDPSIIVSIGMIYGDTDKTYEDFLAMQDANKIRHEKLSEVVEKAGTPRTLFTCADNNFGGSDPEYNQGPLQEVTPEVVELMKKLNK